MTRGYVRPIAVMAALVPLSHLAIAQSKSLEPLSTYSEIYLAHPKVSGNLLVGLRWKSPAGHFDPGDVGIKATSPKFVGNVCVDVMSKDGRYTAENAYNLDNPFPARLFKSNTAYARELHDYDIDDIAVIVRRTASCDTSDVQAIIPATVLPAGAPPVPQPERELIASVNADPGRATIAILDRQDNVVSSGACEPAGTGVRIAYSSVCTVTVPSEIPAAGLRLQLSIKERFKTVPSDYNLLLP